MIMSLFTLVNINTSLSQDVQLYMQFLAETCTSKCNSWPRRAILNASLGQDLACLDASPPRLCTSRKRQK